MVISSRTPEGDPNHCPICGHDFRLEPSWPARDGPCPSCGHLLWFPHPQAQVSEKARAVLRRAILRMGTARLGPPSPAAQQAIEAVRELSELRGLIVRVRKASKWEELVSGS